MSRRFTLTITLTAITLLSAGVVWFTNSRAASDPTGLPLSTPQGPGLERYVDPERGFFFDYPDTLSLTETDAGEEHTIFGDTSEAETRFMIVSYPYVLDEPFTEELIRAQPSAANITSVIARLSLPSGTTAFVFRRARTPLGEPRDALFLHNGTVYHVSVMADFEDLFNQILQSWRFASSTTL